MTLWQSHRYIRIFGYRFYYKRHFLKFCQVLGLSYYRNWVHYHNHRKHQSRKANGEKANPNWTRMTRAKLIKLHGEKCADCGTTENLTIDHIIPLFRIGKVANEIENLQLLCLECHVKKERIDNYKRFYSEPLEL